MVSGIEKVRSIVAEQNAKTAELLDAVDEVAAFNGTGGAMVTGMPAPRPAASGSADVAEGVASVAAPGVASVAARRDAESAEVDRKEKAAQCVECSVCGSVYRRSNHSFHIRAQKHLSAERRCKGIDIQ